MKYILLIISLLLIACDDSNDNESGNRNLTTENINVSGVKGVSISGDGNLIIAKGEEELQIETDENLHDNLIAKVNSDGILELSLKDSNPSTRVNYFITLPDFEYISVAGSGFVIADTLFAEDDLEIDISGDGNLRFEDMQIDDLTIEISGSGDLRMAGTCKKLDLDINGTGQASLIDFLVSNAEINISGSGSVEISVSDLLEVNIKGSGKVDYKGNPDITQNVSGSGSINKIGD